MWLRDSDQHPPVRGSFFWRSWGYRTIACTQTNTELSCLQMRFVLPSALTLHSYLVSLICFIFLNASPVSLCTDATVAMNYGLFMLRDRVAALLKKKKANKQNPQGSLQKFVAEPLSAEWYCSETVLSPCGAFSLFLLTHHHHHTPLCCWSSPPEETRDEQGGCFGQLERFRCLLRTITPATESNS